MAQLERSLNAILQDKTEARPIKICHVKDIQSFFSNNFEQKRKILCRYFQKGQCNKGFQCLYSHDKELLKQQRFKIELCKNFMDSGNCKFKDSCTFAHGRSDLKNK